MMPKHANFQFLANYFSNLHVFQNFNIYSINFVEALTFFDFKYPAKMSSTEHMKRVTSMSNSQ